MYHQTGTYPNEDTDQQESSFCHHVAPPYINKPYPLRPLSPSKAELCLWFILTISPPDSSTQVYIIYIKTYHRPEVKQILYRQGGACYR